MSAPAYQPGDRVTAGTVFRRVPNTYNQWSNKRNRPTKLAFRPDPGEWGVSVHLTHLTTADDVLGRHEEYGLVVIDVTQMIAAAGEKGSEVAVLFKPSDEDGPAHCLMHSVISGAMDRLDSAVGQMLSAREDLVKVARPPGPLRDGVSARD